jgi:His Kinase A (phospho-acceptor) domain
MSILDTSPIVDPLRGSSRSDTPGVPSASSNSSKTRPSQTWERRVGNDEPARGSSKKKPPLRGEDSCDAVEKDLPQDLHIRESAAVLGQICHDIRQPVISLLACVELLADSMGTGMTAEQKELIASMQASSQCMLQLVDDSLELAFAASGPLVFDPSLVTAIGEQGAATNRPVADRRQTHSELQRKR